MRASDKVQKFAVLSMDVEDWYHTGYLRANECRRDVSLLDGLDLFVEVLQRQQIRGQFFVLSDLLQAQPRRFAALASGGHEIASHGRAHVPPTEMTVEEFRAEVAACQKIHKDVLGLPLLGFRATRFMLDRARLEILQQSGFHYDSSLICRRMHSDFDFSGFSVKSPQILHRGDFFEFRPANFSLAGFNWPVSGGGAMRILPWWLTALPLRWHARNLELYSFYIHPLDLSRAEFPPVPDKTTRLQRWRMNTGRMGMAQKFAKLIALLRDQGSQFTTYRDLRGMLTSHQSLQPQNGLALDPVGDRVG